MPIFSPLFKHRWNRNKDATLLLELLQLTFFYIHITSSSNIYILTQTQLLSNIIHPTPDYLK